jgi:hypothetical protein
MKRLFGVGLVALALLAVFPDDASARRGSGGGFSRGAAISHGGGFRGAAMVRGPSMNGFRHVSGRPGGYALHKGIPSGGRAAWWAALAMWPAEAPSLPRGWLLFVGVRLGAGYCGYSHYYGDSCIITGIAASFGAATVVGCMLRPLRLPVLVAQDGRSLTELRGASLRLCAPNTTPRTNILKEVSWGSVVLPWASSAPTKFRDRWSPVPLRAPGSHLSPCNI